MLLSQLLGERYREKPSDASIPSHIFMLKGGYIRQVANGIFSLLPPTKRITRKIEEIIRQEMDRIGGQEVLFPVVLPRDLWDESGRYDSVGSELLRFTDRSGAGCVLGMTHEEAAVHLARSEAKSYQKYPFMIYQIQTKFRDEPRARGGLIRVREFTMKDAYSFHTSQEDLERYYKICFEAYERIFARCGVPEVISVTSDSGMMGGAVADEFMLLCDAGEDTIVTCPHCGYRSNMEVAEFEHEAIERPESEIQKVATPGVKTIDELVAFFEGKVPPQQMIKATVFAVENSDRVVIVFIRADYEVNEAKLRRIVGANVFPLTDYSDVDLAFGSLGPYQLNPGKCEVYYDETIAHANDMSCGANEDGYHYTGVCMDRDIKPEKYIDVAKVITGSKCAKCGQELKLSRGVEVGNIFQLGTKYTESMGMTYTDKDGTQKTPIMGCYGIGVGRLAACIIEAHHDENGPIWPYAVAPWQIHICALSNKKMDVMPIAKDLYDKLGGQYEVVLDDRGANAGVQFADADLLGVPIRIVVGVKNAQNGQVEISTRDKSIQEVVDIADVPVKIAEIVEKIK
ncbi:MULTISPECIES: proline--tRNA ligase [Clostridiaceae]|uniref:Proline--tRNA ligase n=1 Tax=Clostridium facile TaxID=2763035 RepID=A0ABR7IS70_9CLOT|nr:MULTISPECIES: proline--tRNA ligase [Clostridiaceae]MBC5787999.1 proline--tRNA ligase [Clostridium facile]